MSPAYGVVRRLTTQASVLLAPNPGPMTLAGTNSYLLVGPGAESGVVVDPGPDDTAHLARLAAADPPVGLILLTHRHLDHCAGAPKLHRMTGAPVRAFRSELCLGQGGPLSDGEDLDGAGLGLTVLGTAGHTSDSVCLVLRPRAGADPTGVLTGDTVLGSGTTVLDHPDGRLGDYLRSLERLRALGPLMVLPGHGPARPDLAGVCTDYLRHRRERLDEIRAVYRRVGPRASVREVTDLVYTDVAPEVRAAAEQSVAAQLAYLRV